MNSDFSEPEAWALYETKNYADSAKTWEQLLESAPNDTKERSRLLNGYVYALVSLKRFDEARKIHQDLFEKHKSHIDLHQLAFVEREAGNLETALKHIHEERQLIAPSEWNYLGANSYELGKLSELLGELDRALHFAKQCEEESSHSSDLVLKACAQRLLGDVFAKLEKPSSAHSHYSASKKLFEEAEDSVGAAEIEASTQALNLAYEDCEISQATLDDLLRISEIERASYHPDLVTSLKGFHEFLASQGEDDFLLCAKSKTSKKVLGFVCFATRKPTVDVSTIWDLCVDAEFRSLKVGRRLMEKAIAQCLGKTPSLSLHVPKGNRQALQLYESLGFQKVQTLEAYYPENEDGWVMVKTL